MAQEVVLSYLPGSVPHERIVISLSQGGEGWSIGLHQQHWAVGIGWYDQKVMRLDARQWSTLRSMFSAQLPSLDDSLPDQPVSIPFPGPRETTPILRRTADHA